MLLSDICKPVVCRWRQRLSLERLKHEPLRVEEDKEVRRAVLGLPFLDLEPNSCDKMAHPLLGSVLCKCNNGGTCKQTHTRTQLGGVPSH